MLHPEWAVLLVLLPAACGGQASQRSSAGHAGASSVNADASASIAGSLGETVGDAAPGADASADATTPLVDADTAPFECAPEVTSSLEGAWIELVEPVRCEFSLAEAMAGISIPYRIHFEHDIANVMNGDNSLETQPTGLHFLESIAGNQQHYCVCDPGYGTFDCLELRADYGAPWPEDTPACNFHTLKAGVYKAAFHWDGRNWNGPSDTTNPEGDSFPAGDYVFTVNAEGYLGPSAPYGKFQINAKLPVRLLP